MGRTSRRNGTKRWRWTSVFNIGQLLLAAFVGLMLALPAAPRLALAEWDEEAAALLVLINNYRQQNGREPVALDARLQQTAQWHADNQVKTANCLAFFTGGPPCSHTDTQGRSPGARAQSFGYPNGAVTNYASEVVEPLQAQTFPVPQASWTGTWTLGERTLVLTQDGNRVTGTYLTPVPRGRALDAGNPGNPFFTDTSRVAVERDGAPWMLTVGGDIFHGPLEGDGFNWTWRPQLARDITVGLDGSVWMVGTDGAPYKWNGNAWDRQPGEDLVAIAVDQAGVVWGVNGRTQILRGTMTTAVAPAGSTLAAAPATMQAQPE
jgi:hypothetical protein